MFCIHLVSPICLEFLNAWKVPLIFRRHLMMNVFSMNDRLKICLIKKRIFWINKLPSSFWFLSGDFFGDRCCFGTLLIGETGRFSRSLSSVELPLNEKLRLNFGSLCLRGFNGAFFRLNIFADCVTAAKNSSSEVSVILKRKIIKSKKLTNNLWLTV